MRFLNLNTIAAAFAAILLTALTSTTATAQPSIGDMMTERGLTVGSELPSCSMFIFGPATESIPNVGDAKPCAIGGNDYWALRIARGHIQIDNKGPFQHALEVR